VPFITSTFMTSASEPLAWISIDNTEAERLICITASSSRLMRTAGYRQWMVLPLWVLIGGLISWFGEQTPLTAMLLLIFGVFGAQLISQRILIRHYARTITSHYCVALSNEGLHIEATPDSSFCAWPSLAGLERRNDGLLLFLRDYHILFVPARCFADSPSYKAWCESVESLSGLSTREAAPPPAPQANQGLLSDLSANLRAGLGLALFRRTAVSHLRASVPQLLLLFALGLGLGLVFDLTMIWPEPGMFNQYAIANQLFPLLLVLLVAWLCQQASPRPKGLLLAAMALLAPIQVLNILMMLVIIPLYRLELVQASWIAAWLILGWMFVASIVALVNSLELQLSQRLAPVLGISLLFGAQYLLQTHQYRLWTEDYRYDEESTSTWERSSNERVLYAQPELLSETLTQIAPGQPGRPELYLLALGGYGAQDVFLREVLSVETLFSERFDTTGRSAVLINNPATVEQRPMATTIALQRTLAEMGRKMNQEEDVLFLFMTSHGAEDHEFSLNLWPFRFDALTPEKLKTMLDDAGIRNRVIVVSACYSGGFIKPLSNEYTLVMSASREDRNSHGCSHEADWTFFGKAYFDEALRTTHNFEEAFHKASTLIAAREAAEGYPPSEPQIAVGQAIRPVLQALEARRSKTPHTFASNTRP
jgi:hypothetical protein